MFVIVRAFGHDPSRALLQSCLLEQQGERDAGPLAATRIAVSVLHGAFGRNSQGAARSPGRAIAMTLDKMKTGDGRQAHQIPERERHRAIDQAVNQQAMFPRIDVRRLVAVRDDVVQ